MPEMNDMELLREFVSRHSEEAFATLMSRHLNLVYSAALRHVGNHHQAEEISQAVFVILARKARSLSSGTILAGWLFRATRLTAANYLRTERRRIRREQEADMQSNGSDNTDELWQQAAPVLNEVIDSLGEKERNAVVLRYLQGKNYREVAAVLGGSEAAAQMRVSRALEKMRKLFAKRKLAFSATALSGMMAAHGTQAAPSSVAIAVSAAAKGTALSASTLSVVEGTLKLMAWTKVKIAVGASVVALLAYQSHQNAVQARQVDAARETLSLTRQTFAAQEDQIATLERQNTAIVDTRENQAQELQRLRVRRTAAASVAQTNPAANATTTLLSATLRDPAARALLRTQLVNSARMRYAAFAEELKIDPEEGEKLVQLAGDEAMKVLEAVAAFTDGKISAEDALKVEGEAFQNGKNEVRSKLGDEGLAKFDEYTSSYPSRTLVAQFNKQLGPFPLSVFQQEGLLKIFQNEPSEMTRQLAGEIPAELVVYPEKLDQRFEEQAAANQRIREKAAGMLSPEQLEALEAMQAKNLSAEKQNILRMLRKS